ncbi:MAG: hypothetical protein AAF411_12350 [Myxococcota bacterium]
MRSLLITLFCLGCVDDLDLGRSADAGRDSAVEDAAPVDAADTGEDAEVDASDGSVPEFRTDLSTATDGAAGDADLPADDCGGTALLSIVRVEGVSFIERASLEVDRIAPCARVGPLPILADDVEPFGPGIYVIVGNEGVAFVDVDASVLERQASPEPRVNLSPVHVFTVGDEAKLAGAMWGRPPSHYTAHRLDGRSVEFPVPASPGFQRVLTLVGNDALLADRVRRPVRLRPLTGELGPAPLSDLAFDQMNAVAGPPLRVAGAFLDVRMATFEGDEEHVQEASRDEVCGASALEAIPDPSGLDRVFVRCGDAQVVRYDFQSGSVERVFERTAEDSSFEVVSLSVRL